MRRVAQWPIALALQNLSRKHLSKNRKQLVVFSFDHIAALINIDGVYEKDELDAFFAWLDRCNVSTNTSAAIDVGANIGNHSLYFSDYFQTVHSFEPNRRTFKVLTLNSELVNNVVCYNFGISDAMRKAELSINAGNVGGAFISDLPGRNTQTVELRTLDSMTEITNVRLIKIDVEGHEFAAIRGAIALIRANRPIIMFEQHASDFSNGESAVLQLLEELGYRNFATVRRHPYVNGGILKKALVLPFMRLWSGESMRVKIETQIEPGFYAFIVGLPDWFPLTDDVR